MLAPIFVAGLLLIALLGVLLVDVLQWGGQAWLASRTDQPLLWHHLFREKGIAAVLHWALLGTLVIASGLQSGRLQAHGETREARFWLLMAATAGLLMIHATASFNLVAFFSLRILQVGGSHPAWVFSQLAYYAILAVVPVYALVRYRDVTRSQRSIRLLYGGLGIYGATAIIRIAARRVDWFERAGGWLWGHQGGLMFNPEGFTRPAREELILLPLQGVLHLVAVALLLAAVVAYRQEPAPRPSPAARSDATASTEREPPEADRPLENGPQDADKQEDDGLPDDHGGRR